MFQPIKLFGKKSKNIKLKTINVTTEIPAVLFGFSFPSLSVMDVGTVKLTITAEIINKIDNINKVNERLNLNLRPLDN